MFVFGTGTLPMMLFISVAFSKMSAKFRGMMLKSAAMIMILMGANTFYMGLSFYVEENFEHRSFLHDLKDHIDGFAVFMKQMVGYIGDMITNLQGI